MDNFDSYVFILCLTVFVVLTGLSIFVIRMLLKLKLKLIRSGVEDQEIKTEYELNQKKKKRIASRIFDKVLAWFFILIFLGIFAFSMFSSVSTNIKIDNIPSFYVVKSSSMSKKHPKNKYLIENKLNNQFSTFDLILTYNVPKEDELKLYDVVVYEVDDVLLIHRIVAIEEPNEKHPTERWFLCQGDNVETPDRFPVRYNQIKAIYKNQNVPFVGSFISFMQSPAGWLCVLLVISANIATPILEKKLNKEKQLRLALCAEQEVAVSAQLAQDNENLFDKFNERKTFKQKLALLDTQKLDWYDQLVYVLKQLPNIRVIEAKYHEAYRIGNKPIAKFAIKGKSLYVYLAVDANEYQGVQYGFKDVSGVKAHGQFTAECKVTSERKLKNVKKLLAGYGENIRLNAPVTLFEQFKNKKQLSLKQKLSRLSPERKERFKEILNILQEKVGLTKRESKSSITFKHRRMPVAKLTVKGKSVYAYLAVDPKEYVLAKYGIKDVANVKAHKDYPAECKLTSQRKMSLTKQIIEKIVAEAIRASR